MKVLIVNTNRFRHPVPVLPAGACMVAEAATRAGHQVAVADLQFSKNPTSTLEKALRKAAPDVIGLSVRNIDTGVFQSPQLLVSELPGLVETIRRYSSNPIVLGGGAVAILPEELLRTSGADWAVLGEGEEVLPRLLSILAQKRDSPPIPGTARLTKGKFLRGGPAPYPVLSACRIPEFSRWISLRPYLRRYATAPIQTKRGCPFECVYCTYPILEGKEYRLCPPETVAEEILRFQGQGWRDLEFVDNLFNSPYEHALAICERLGRLSSRVRLHTYDLSPQFLDGPLLAAMEKAGFAGLGITAESAVDSVLQGLGKDFTAEDLKRAAEAVRHYDIPCLWIFMLGGVGETMETVRKTIHFAESRLGPRDVAYFMLGVRIFPGTRLEGLARKQGVLKGSSANLLNPTFYFSPEIDPQSLMANMAVALKKNRNFVTFDYTKTRIFSALQRAAHLLRLSPPLFQHTRKLRRVLDWIGTVK